MASVDPAFHFLSLSELNSKLDLNKSKLKAIYANEYLYMDVDGFVSEADHLGPPTPPTVLRIAPTTLNLRTLVSSTMRSRNNLMLISFRVPVSPACELAPAGVAWDNLLSLHPTYLHDHQFLVLAAVPPWSREPHGATPYSPSYSSNSIVPGLRCV